MAGRTKVVAQALTLGAVAGLLVLLVWKVAHDERSDVPKQLASGATPMAPAFSLPRLDREGELSLVSLRGKAVIVNFWASWCDPCKEEAPVLERAWREHRGAGLVVVGVDANDFKGDARAFARRNRMSYPIVHDARAGSLGDYGVKNLPETFIVDRRGRIVGQISGQLDASDDILARFDSFVSRALRPS
jgi:cytochrome c biogenesis protein CcmG, thiol:disulfide interchange protein DsbE